MTVVRCSDLIASAKFSTNRWGPKHLYRDASGECRRQVMAANLYYANRDTVLHGNMVLRRPCCRPPCTPKTQEKSPRQHQVALAVSGGFADRLLASAVRLAGRSSRWESRLNTRPKAASPAPVQGMWSYETPSVSASSPAKAPAALPILNAPWLSVDARLGAAEASFTTRICSGETRPKARTPHRKIVVPASQGTGLVTVRIASTTMSKMKIAITDGINRQSASRPPRMFPSARPTPKIRSTHVTWCGDSRVTFSRIGVM